MCCKGGVELAATPGGSPSGDTPIELRAGEVSAAVSALVVWVDAKPGMAGFRAVGLFVGVTPLGVERGVATTPRLLWREGTVGEAVDVEEEAGFMGVATGPIPAGSGV